ncbi:hypothetical protein MRB53_003498 [Persea americana]|uniref:Uncharacterized protein n=1 Tax=Persea americana TaxID=3435 RepID=A0ACC2MXV5_PERAE|nr:hypothetical protein MRB53_003498 [Persea americana]
MCLCVVLVDNIIVAAHQTLDLVVTLNEVMGVAVVEAVDVIKVISNPPAVVKYAIVMVILLSIAIIDSIRLIKVHLRSSPTVHANVPIGPPPLLPFGSSCVMPTTQVPAEPDHVAFPLQTVTTSTQTPVQQPPSNEQSPNIAPSSPAVPYLLATQ